MGYDEIFQNMMECVGISPQSYSIYVRAPNLHISSQERCMGYDGIFQNMMECVGISPQSYLIYVRAPYLYISSQERCMGYDGIFRNVAEDDGKLRNMMKYDGIFL